MPASDYFLRLQDVDMKGTNIGGERKGMNLEDCQANCANDPNCHFIVHNGSSCWFRKIGNNDGSTKGSRGTDVHLFASRLSDSANPKYIKIPAVNISGFRVQKKIRPANQTDLMTQCDAYTQPNRCNAIILDNNGDGYLNTVDPQYSGSAGYHPDINGNGNLTTWFNGKSPMQYYCKDKWSSDPQCRTSQACKELGPDGTCDSVYTDYCSQGDRIFTDGLCTSFVPSKPQVVGDLKMAWCKQGKNFNDSNCTSFCNATSGGDTTNPGGYKGQCDSLYTTQCAASENQGLDICSCVVPWKHYQESKDVADATTAATVDRSGGVPAPQCYFATCIGHGYKTAASGTQQCNACIQSQTLGIQGSTNSSIKNASQTCNVTLANQETINNIGPGGTSQPVSLPTSVGTGLDAPPPPPPANTSATKGPAGSSETSAPSPTPKATETPKPSLIPGMADQQAYILMGVGVVVLIMVIVLAAK
jgi:PAN-like domain